MQAFIDDITLKLFGRNEKTEPGLCVTCGSSDINASDFRDELSVKEFSISRMCQKCQDDVFG
jgi:hypothetical protein